MVSAPGLLTLGFGRGVVSAVEPQKRHYRSLSLSVVWLYLFAV
jgi:hypothetical protein